MKSFSCNTGRFGMSTSFAYQQTSTRGSINALRIEENRSSQLTNTSKARKGVLRMGASDTNGCQYFWNILLPAVLESVVPLNSTSSNKRKRVVSDYDSGENSNGSWGTGALLRHNR